MTKNENLYWDKVHHAARMEMMIAERNGRVLDYRNAVNKVKEIVKI
tara:strand:+ start:184 stop:321 length:138 start_codon:yes stop_codon:yes gene_type:complete